MKYVIKCANNGKFTGMFLCDANLNPTGQSYTKDLELATIFNDFQSAKDNCCPQNESPVPLDSLLKGARG